MTRTVKPLEWCDETPSPQDTSPGSYIKAESILGRYRIDYFEDDAVIGGPFLLTIPGETGVRCLKSWNDAREKGDAHYEGRIRSALIPISVAEADPDWEDADVQIIYDIICSDNTPPENFHWEGFVSIRIAKALRAIAGTEEAENETDA